MSPLSPDLFTSLRSTLLHCREFESYRVLLAVLTNSELAPFRFYLRQADNRSDLVDFFLADFVERKFADGRAVISEFLTLLCDRYDPADALRTELDQLYAAVMRSSPPAKVLSPGQKHQLYDRLLQFDYREQVRAVRQVIDHQHVAAFIIHGPPDYGQRVLAHRLTHIQPQWASGRHIVIDAGSNGTGKSSRSLWREIAKRLDLPSETDPALLAEKVCQWWQTQDIILVLHTIDYIPTTLLTEWLAEFWQPLVGTARSCDYAPHASTHLLLFMVDYSGCVCNQGLAFVDDPELIPTTYLPLRLPPNSLFPENELDIWMDTASEVLPSRLNCQALLAATGNGIPELVYEKICAHCGLSWEGEFAP